VYQTEGIRGFYRGLTASYAGISETIICFAIYESLKKCLKEVPLASSTNGTEKNSTSFFGLMAAAAISKGCASCIAYPHGMFCFFFPEQQNMCQVCHLSLASLLATQEVEIRRSQLQTNSLHISKKNPTQNRAGGVAQVNSSRISKREAEFKPQWPAPAPQKKKILVTRSVSALQEFQFGIHA
jgi:hypothetical protein